MTRGGASGGSPPRRVIVVPVARSHDDRILLCRMAPDRGVFPGQWALPGGGVEPGERIAEALDREVAEELGVRVVSAEPLLFRDAVLPKTLPGGRVVELHMVFLIYGCRLSSEEVILGEEFVDYRWFSRAELADLRTSELTRETLRMLDLVPSL